MTRMTREEAAEILDGRNIVPMPVYLKALEAAARWLVESQSLARKSPAKPGRTRWEGCRHCNSKFGAYYPMKPCGNGDLGARAQYIHDSTHDIVIYVDRHTASGYFRINYCPICGKPLTEEACAELERRIGGGPDA